MVAKLLGQQLTAALEFAWGKDAQSPTGEATPTKLIGGSSGDEKSELSNVDSDTHSSK